MPISILSPPNSCRTSPQPDDDDCLFPEFPLFGDRRESDTSEWSSESSPTDESDESSQHSSLGRRMSDGERQRIRVTATTLGKDGLHTPPHSPRSTSPPSPKAGSSPLATQFPRTFGQPSTTAPSSLSSSATFPTGGSAPCGTTARSIRPRGLTPLTPVAPSPSGALGRQPGMPKSQPLSRALFARMADAPHAGMGPGGKGQKGKGQKVIVPGKAFRTSFTMDMTASELARRA
ncbi:hypothetical protein IAT38_003266 [Cryptococcus sp. DSM 104549]